MIQRFPVKKSILIYEICVVVREYKSKKKTGFFDRGLKLLLLNLGGGRGGGVG